MRVLTTVVYTVITTLLIACEQKTMDSTIDPDLGRECFEFQRSTLPPGTQYEGIAGATGNRITIRIMDGVDLTTVDCELNPEGGVRRNSGS
jgi:hypothetical protein